MPAIQFTTRYSLNAALGGGGGGVLDVVKTAQQRTIELFKWTQLT